MSDKYVNELIRITRKYLKTKQFKEALNHANKILEIKPTSRKGAGLKKEIISELFRPLKVKFKEELKMRDYFSILETLEELKEIDEENKEFLEMKFEFEKNKKKILKEMIDKDIKNKNYERAIEGLTEYGKLYPEEEIATSKKIEDVNQKAIILKTQNLHNSAKKAFKSKNYNLAIKEVKKLLEISPDNKEFISLSAKIYEEYINLMVKSKNFEKANELVDELLEIDPNNQLALIQKEKVIPKYKKQTSLNSLFETLEEQIKNKNYEDAANIIEKILETDPENVQALSQREFVKQSILSEKYKKEITMIETYLKHGGYKRAKEDLEKILKQAPEFKKAKTLFEQVKNRA
ncbi:MAG: tetratricopeptide repeat protein [Candidatus Helarchaeota archaeon]